MLFKLLGQTPELMKLSLVDLSPIGISQRVSPAPGSTTVFLKNRSLPKLTTVFLCNSMEHTNMILQRLPDPIQMLHIASFALQHLETLLRWNKIMDRMCTSSGNAADEVCAHVPYGEKLARIYRQPVCDIRLATITSTPKRRFQFTSTIAGLLYTLRSILYIELDPRTFQELRNGTTWRHCRRSVILPRKERMTTASSVPPPNRRKHSVHSEDHLGGLLALWRGLCDARRRGTGCRSLSCMDAISTRLRSRSSLN
jgi:hypothetical protein